MSKYIDKLIETLLETCEIQNNFEYENFETLIEYINVFLDKEYKVKHNYIIKTLSNIIHVFDLYDPHDFVEDDKAAEIYENIALIKQLYISENKIFDFYKEDISKLVLLRLLLILYLSIGYFEINIDEDDLESFKRHFEYKLDAPKKESIFWYRGVTNFDYDLVPSIYRDLPKGKHYLIHNREIESLYEDNKLLTEYSKIFNEKHILSNNFLTYIICNTLFLTALL